MFMLVNLAKKEHFVVVFYFNNGTFTNQFSTEAFI